MQPVELAPGPGVRLVHVEVGARAEADGAQVALAADGVGGVGGGGGVGVAQPVAEAGDGFGGPGGGGVEFGAQPLGAVGGEVGEPARAAALPARPGGELVDDGRCLPGCGEQAPGDAFGEGGPVAVEGAGYVAQPAGRGRPVLVALGGPQAEDLPYLVDGRGDIAQLAETVARVVHGERGGEAFPQQPGAGLLGRVGAAGPCRGGVEFGEGASVEGGGGLEAFG